jgi:hypothetical protein
MVCARLVHPAVETTLGFRGFTTPGVGVSAVLTEIGGHTTYAFGYPLAFDRDHLGKQAFGTFGCTAPKMTLAGLGAYELAGASQSEALGGRFMRLEFVLFLSLLSHEDTPSK